MDRESVHWQRTDLVFGFEKSRLDLVVNTLLSLSPQVVGLIFSSS